MKLKAKWMGLALTGVALSGCGALLGLDEFTEGAGGAGTGTSTSAETSSTSTGGGECTGVETQTCYEFDAATLGKGVCNGGTKTCKDGVFGACEGQVGPSAEDCSKPEDENCDGVACSEAIWSEQFGGGDTAFTSDLATDPTGNVLVAGTFTGNLNFGSTAGTNLDVLSGSAMFLAKLGPDGSHVWSKSFAPKGDAAIFARVSSAKDGQIFLSGYYKVGIDLGGGVLNATGNQDFFVASFDKDGKHLWSKTFGLDSDAFVRDIAVGPDGDPVIVGEYGNGSLTFGGSTYSSPPMNTNAFVAKLAHADGSEIWSRSYGDVPNYPAGNQSATAVAVDSTNNVVIAGTLTAEIDLGLGVTDFSPDGGLDVFVAGLDSKGAPIWHTYFHGPADQIASAVAVDSMGSTYITGAFSGSTQFDSTDLSTMKTTTSATDNDVFLVKLKAQGKHAWMKQYGDASAQVNLSAFQGLSAPLSVAVDSKDNVLLAGGYLGTMSFGMASITSAGDSDWFLGKLDSDGAYLWSKSFGDSAPAQLVAGIGADPKTGAVVIGGVNDGSLAIGPGAPLKAKGPVNVAVAKLNP